MSRIINLVFILCYFLSSYACSNQFTNTSNDEIVLKTSNESIPYNVSFSLNDSCKVEILRAFYFETSHNFGFLEDNFAIEYKIENFNEIAGTENIALSFNMHADVQRYNYIKLNESGLILLNQDYFNEKPSDNIRVLVTYQIEKGLDSISISTRLNGKEFWHSIKTQNNQFPDIVGFDPIRNLEFTDIPNRIDYNKFDTLVIFRSHVDGPANDLYAYVDFKNEVLKFDTTKILSKYHNLSITKNQWASYLNKQISFSDINQEKSLFNLDSLKTDGKYYFKLRFYKDDILYLVSQKGIAILSNEPEELSYEFKLNEKHISYEYLHHSPITGISWRLGNFVFYDGDLGIVFDDRILKKENGKWKTVFIFPNEYKYETSIVSFDSKGLYFTENRKLYYTDFDTIYPLLENRNNIVEITKGPNNTILFRLGFNKDDHIAGIYFLSSQKSFLIKKGFVSNNYSFDFLCYNLFYWSRRGKIVIDSSHGIYSFSFDDLMNKFEEK